MNRHDEFLIDRLNRRCGTTEKSEPERRHLNVEIKRNNTPEEGALKYHYDIDGNLRNAEGKKLTGAAKESVLKSINGPLDIGHDFSIVHDCGCTCGKKSPKEDVVSTAEQEKVQSITDRLRKRILIAEQIVKLLNEASVLVEKAHLNDSLREKINIARLDTLLTLCDFYKDSSVFSEQKIKFN